VEMRCPECDRPIPVPTPYSWAWAGHIVNCPGCGLEWDVYLEDAAPAGAGFEPVFTLRLHPAVAPGAGDQE
jgi:hypothetical protein